MIKDMNISMQDIVFVLGLIGMFGTALAVINKMPLFTYEKRIEKLENHEKTNFKALEENTYTNNLLCKAMIALIDNKITGNSIVPLKEVKGELIDHITKTKE